MSLLRRTLLLAAIALGGLALLAPLATRSAAPVPADVADALLPVADVPMLGVNRGALTGRNGATTPTAEAPSAAEAVAPGSADSPAAVPMEATLIVVARPAPARAITYAGSSVWDDLARCESGGNWAIDTGNGYYGGLQFGYETWHTYGGREFAEYPHEATREEQIVVAERLRAVRGYAPWPSCRVKLGLP